MFINHQGTHYDSLTSSTTMYMKNMKDTNK